MQIRNSPEGYGLVARFLHWSMFLLIGLTTFLALNMESMEEADKLFTEGLHRSLGLLILALLLLRFAWKLNNPRPADPPGSAWVNWSAHALHWLFYFIILLQVVAGITMSQADGEPVGFFGLFSLPALIGPDEDVEEFWEEIHEVNWIVLSVLVIGHVVAALRHLYSEKDDVFRRMWSGPR